LPFGLYFSSQTRSNFIPRPFTPGIKKLGDLKISPEFNGDGQIVITPMTESQAA
jgi:hypothetical protein